MHFYPHHIGDFLRDTHSLTPQESYWYLRLIWLYYETEKPLPDDVPNLCFKIGARGHEDTVRILLQNFFRFDPYLKSHTHQRIDREIAKYQRKAASANRANQMRWASETDLKSEKKSDTDQILTKNQEPRTNKEHTPQVADLLPDVDPAVLKDFVALRKKLRAPITEVAAKGLIREAEKAGITLTQALTICCERSWRGFNADWLKDKKAKSDEFDWDEALRGAA
jgi:uncharacterized protein YdaU (DUF1376 family)